MNKYHLDSCSVKLSIPLAAHIERLKISEEVSSRFKVKVVGSAAGINISGRFNYNYYSIKVYGVINL